MLRSLSDFLHRKLDGFTCDEYIIMFLVCSIFLPFYCSMIVIAGILFYLLIKGRLLGIIRNISKSYFAIAFCIITTLVALFYKNWLGAVCGVAILLIFLFVFYYRTYTNKRLFELLLDACCIISLFCVVWALMEYVRIINRLDYHFLDLVIEDSPKDRVNSTFFNANYYAMMIEFIVLICVYKMMQVKTLRRIVFYLFTIAANLFALYLTGCRTAWIPFVVTVPFMFLMNKRFGFFSFSMGAIAVSGISLLVYPELMQRTSILGDFLKRAKIWKTAVKGIKAHPLFGEGPLTYYHIYKQYGGHPTQHAHNVILDPLLSHGLIPCIILLVYLGSNLKEVWLLFKRRIDMRLFSLIVAFLLTVLIHGILDYTIYWVQTSLLFFIVFSASSIYFHKEEYFDEIER